MKNSQPTRPTTKGENDYSTSKCPCPGKQEFTRKANRSPLRDIQDSGNKKQYLSAEQIKDTLGKSLALRSPGTSFRSTSINAESTRIIQETPAFKLPLLKLPETITVHKKSQKSGSERSSIPVRSKSSSSYKACRCAGAKSVASVANNKENDRFSTDKVIDLYASDDDIFHNKKVSTGRSTCKNRSDSGQRVKITSSDHNSASHGIRHSPMPSTPSQSRSRSISNTKKSTPNSTSKKVQNSAALKQNQGCCSTKSVAKTSSSQQLSQIRKHNLTGSQPQGQEAQELNLAQNKKEHGRSACKNRSDPMQSVQITSSDQKSASRGNQLSMLSALSQGGKKLSGTNQSNQNSEDFVPWINPNISSASKSTPKTFKNSAASKDKQGCCSAKSTAKTSSSQQCLLSQNPKYLSDSQPQVQEAQELSSAYNKKISAGRSASKNRSDHGQSVKITSSDRQSASQGNRLSIPSALSQGGTILSETKQSIQNGEDFVPWINPNILSGSNSTSKTSQNSAASNDKQCCSEKSTTKMDLNPFNYVTLPSQQFVSLYQDTANTTIIAADSSHLSTIINPALDKVTVIRDSSLFSEEEKPFVDGREFFQDLDQGKCSTIRTMPIHSPLIINVPVRRSTSLSESDSTRRVKTTLRRTSSIKKAIVYPLLYSPEYIEDIITYAYKQKGLFLVKPESIIAYVDKRYRTLTINWLLQITELVSPDFTTVYYTAVRIFDRTVIELGLRKTNYCLAAIVALWISLKYLDQTVLLKVPKIFSLCSGQYSKDEILSLERNMLKSIQFCLTMSDPLDFLNYYLHYASLENNEVLRYGSKFVMECATLFETYATEEAPLIAASALYLTIKVLRNTREIYINFIWYDRKIVQKFAESVLLANVQSVIMNKYEPWNRYLTPAKLKVAKEFIKTIILS